MNLPPDNFTYQPPPDNGLQIIYRDDALLALDKPSGLLSVPGRGEAKQDSLALRVQREYPDARVVHRLDLCTSGIMIMARGDAIQRHLNRLFAERTVEKRYLAVVNGRPDTEHGTVALPLITDWPNRPRQKIDHALGKPATTHYRLLEYRARHDSSLLELIPVTGRSHQLRVHMRAIGHPILGDNLYADPATRAKAPRLLLHATDLTLMHPSTGRRLHLHSEAAFTDSD